MDEIQTPGAEAEVPATVAVVAEPVAEVPNVAAAPSAEAEVVAVVTEAPSILKSELAHVFEAFEHFSLMEGISRLYALAKKHL